MISWCTTLAEALGELRRDVFTKRSHFARHATSGIGPPWIRFWLSAGSLALHPNSRHALCRQSRLEALADRVRTLRKYGEIHM